MNNVVINPYEYFADPTKGRPIFNGSIYIGIPDTDPEVPANQKQVYARQENGTEVAIPQPITTNAGGYPTYNGSVIGIIVDGSYSIKVNDKNGVQALYCADRFSWDYSNPNDLLVTATGTTTPRSLADRFADVVNIKDFGGDIQTAIDAIYIAGGGVLNLGPIEYVLSSPLIPKRGVVVEGVQGATRLKLADGANCVLVESFNFDTLYATSAYQVSDNPDYTQNYGFIGCIFDGNSSNQVGQHYCIKMYGRNLVLKNCVIVNSSGVGLWTAQKGFHTGGYDETKTKTHGSIGQIEIINSFEEAWIFEGPSDQAIGHLVVNEVGDKTNDGTTPQTSTHFPGQPVYGLRVEDAMSMSSANLNGVRFGQCLYGNSRLTFGNITLAGGWGNALFTSSCYGSIDSLLVQANPYIWNGVVKPSILNDSDDILIASTTASRITGQDQPTAPLIHDTGGAQWGTIRNRQSLAQGGTVFLADTGVVDIQSISISGASVGINTTSSCNKINVSCTFTNCTTVWDNDATDIRGAWDFTGSIESGQVFATGIDSSPNADEESLDNARIEFLDNGSWKSNHFRGALPFDSTSTTGQSIVFTHNMWRTPKVESITLGARVSGWSSEPEGMSLTINGFNSTTVTARVKLTVAATGSPTAQIVCKV